MTGTRSWSTDPRLTYTARALLWDMARFGPDHHETPGSLAARAARERPGTAEAPAALAAALAELAQAGVLTETAGRYRLAIDRAADLAAAKISGAHLRACRPPLPRPEAAQHQQLIRELILAGRDPACVEQALGQWRDRHAAGVTLGRALLEKILAALEAQWLAAAPAEDYGVLCASCTSWHRAGDPCPPGVTR